MKVIEITIAAAIKTRGALGPKGVASIVCGNLPASAQCDTDSVTITTLQSNGSRCSARDLARLPHHPHVHNRTDVCVLWH